MCGFSASAMARATASACTIEDLALRGLAERRDDGEDAGARRLGDRLVAHRGDLADEAELGAVDATDVEHAGGERPHARAERLERLDELEVRVVEHAAGDLERRGRHLAEALHDGRVDAGARERAVELDVAAVDDDRHEPDALEERERGSERIEVGLDDRAARLDDRELRSVDARVVAKVLLDLFPAADVGQQAGDDVLRVCWGSLHGVPNQAPEERFLDVEAIVRLVDDQRCGELTTASVALTLRRSGRQ